MDLRDYGFLVTLAITVVSVHLHLNVGASGICGEGCVSEWVSQNHFDILNIYATTNSQPDLACDCGTGSSETLLQQIEREIIKFLILSGLLGIILWLVCCTFGHCRDCYLKHRLSPAEAKRQRLQKKEAQLRLCKLGPDKLF